MASDYLLEIDGIKGESKDSKHKETIEIESFSWGATQLGASSHGTGAGAGKVSMNDFHFVMRNNSASPTLFLFCANGKHLKEAKLTCRKAGGTQQNFLVVTMSDVLVSSYQTGGSGGSDDIPTDQISLNFSKVVFTYTPQKADGSKDSPVDGGWDQKKEKAGK